MRGFAGELLVERNLPPQHAVENVGGDLAGGKAGDFRLGRGARTRQVTPIWPAIIATNCGRGANPGAKNPKYSQV